jgi:excisionase family DNA binding protein
MIVVSTRISCGSRWIISMAPMPHSLYATAHAMETHDRTQPATVAYRHHGPAAHAKPRPVAVPTAARRRARPPPRPHWPEPRLQAAELLGISPQRVTDKLESRRLVGIKVGREWRLPRWQFDPDNTSGALPDLDVLQAAFPGGPVSLSRWIMRPHPEFTGAPRSCDPRPRRRRP